jgi:stalled ribosome rescue protein Dom34
MAKIFDLEQEERELSQLHRHLIIHHSGYDAEIQKDCSKFFQKIAKNLQGAKEVLLVGPGLRKKHFARYLEHHDAGLARAVVGLEDSNHLSDKELLALSRKFFRYFDTFGCAPMGKRTSQTA